MLEQNKIYDAINFLTIRTAQKWLKSYALK